MKYFSKKVKNEYGVFDSKAEYERFLQLKHQEEIGAISYLKRQVRFEIIPKLIRKEKVQLKTKTKEVEKVEEMAAHYTADFTYVNANGQFVISECKGGGTLQKLADYVLRRKLIKRIIFLHNEEVGFQDWIFEEYTSNGKRKKKSADSKTSS